MQRSLRNACSFGDLPVEIKEDIKKGYYEDYAMRKFCEKFDGIMKEIKFIREVLRRRIFLGYFRKEFIKNVRELLLSRKIKAVVIEGDLTCVFMERDNYVAGRCEEYTDVEYEYHSQYGPEIFLYLKDSGFLTEEDEDRPNNVIIKDLEVEAASAASYYYN